MNNDINLVSPDLSRSGKAAKGLNNFKLISTLLIIGVGLVSILLFVLNLLLSPEPIVKEQSLVRANIEQAKEKQTRLIVLGKRLNDISSLLSKRANYDIVLDAILSQSPSGISVTSMSVDKKKISMIASADSLLSTNEFIDRFKVMVENKKFLKNVIVNSLTLNPKTSSYTLTLEITLL